MDSLSFQHVETLVPFASVPPVTVKKKIQEEVDKKICKLIKKLASWQKNLLGYVGCFGISRLPGYIIITR